MRRLRDLPLWVLGLLLLVPFLLPVPEVLARRMILWELGDQLHLLLPALLALLLHERGPARGRPWLAAGLALLLSALAELGQQFVGRNPRLGDVGRDVIGIGIALCWLTWRARRSRLALVLGCLLLLWIPYELAQAPRGLSARRQSARAFPLLADFETGWQQWLWNSSDGGQVTYPASGAGHVLELRGRPGQEYPGADLVGFPGDWTPYRWLEFDARAVELGGADSIECLVRFSDYRARRDGAWRLQRFHARAEWQRVRIDLSDLPPRPGIRELRWNDIFNLLFFFGRPQTEVAIQIDNLRLVPFVHASLSPASPARALLQKSTAALIAFRRTGAETPRGHGPSVFGCH